MRHNAGDLLEFRLVDCRGLLAAGRFGAPFLQKEDDSQADGAHKFHCRHHYQQRHVFGAQTTRGGRHFRDRLGIERRGDL